MVPKVLINPQFSFGEMSKTALEMKENLDDICKKELSKISKTGWCHVDKPQKYHQTVRTMDLHKVDFLLCHRHSK